MRLDYAIRSSSPTARRDQSAGRHLEDEAGGGGVGDQAAAAVGELGLRERRSGGRGR